MKKYKKKSNKKGKLLQIRLSEEEYKMVVGFINKFNVTHREWILTSVNELWNYNIIRGGSFWYSDSDFAHANADRKVYRSLPQVMEVIKGEIEEKLKDIDSATNPMWIRKQIIDLITTKAKNEKNS